VTWTSLLANKEAQKHKTSKKELDNMRALIARDLADASLTGLSADRRFATAYNAALQAANMAIACAGYRIMSKVGHHRVSVNESEMSAVISEREIALIAPVSNESETTVSGTLYVDLLDPKDAVVASSKTTEHLKPGRSLIKLSLPRPAIPLVADNDPVLWYRVKYRLLLNDKQAASGVVALGAIAPDMFELRIAHADKALPDQSYRVRIHAANPVTRKPVSGVEVRGELEFDSVDKRAVITHTTNSSGDAVLLFHIPGAVTDGGSINVEARKRDQTRKEDFDFELDPRARIIINTDKLLYQPGQSLHARAIVLSVDKHAVANEDAEFKLVDPESNTVFSSTAKTNDFGIASIDAHERHRSIFREMRFATPHDGASRLCKTARARNHRQRDC
jgi:hypothetical protein